jgi:hypothetical protein
MVNFTKRQLQKIARAAAQNRGGVTLELSKNSLKGGCDCPLELNKTQLNRLKKSQISGRGATLTLSKAQLQRNMKNGNLAKLEGGFLETIAKKTAPFVIKGWQKDGPEFADNLLHNFTGAKHGTVKDNAMVKKAASRVADLIQGKVDKAFSAKDVVEGEGLEGGFFWVPFLYGASKLAQKARGGGLEGMGLEGGFIELLLVKAINDFEKNKRKKKQAEELAKDPVAQEYMKGYIQAAKSKGKSPLAFALTPEGQRIGSLLASDYNRVSGKGVGGGVMGDEADGEKKTTILQGGAIRYD